MAERLGEALLDLRTNDAGFTTGVTQAEARANKLGSTLDKTRGSSAQLATEMTRTGQSAAVMSAGFEQAGQRVTQSSGQQRAGLQQLSFQLNDVATMFALGARPQQIFASQSGQVIQAIQMMTGGTSRLAAFLGGPWGLAITSAAIVLTPFIGKLFEAEDALKGVEFASDNLSDAQSRMSSVIDTTTGAINRQKIELLELVRVQALAEIGRAKAAQQGLSGQLKSAASDSELLRGPGGIPIFGGYPQGFLRRQTDAAEVVSGALANQFSPQTATLMLSQLRAQGKISEAEEIRLSSTIANLGMERINQRRAEAELRFYNGDASAADRALLGVDDLTRGNRRAPSGSTRTSGGVTGPNQGEIDARAEGQLVQLTQSILRARMQMATSADERAELAARGVEWDRRTQIAGIEADERLSAAQREELTAATNRLADTELDAIEFARRIELARDAQGLADERFRGEAEALQNAAALADTEAERKAIALRLLEAEERLERIRLQTIISAAETEEAERERARVALANLDANSAGRRAAVSRQNETEAERYLRNINQTPGQINEALDGISIDGLETLNDGLTRAIMGAESLGDVFSRVADQIIADLLRIAIQQAIIKPLAGALFGGEGGGGGALGSLFAGFFAKGGTIPTGQFGIVGEDGPELAFAGPGGLGIMSNSDSQGMLGGGAGAITITIPISIDATGADAAAIARVNAKVDQLRAELPGRIISTVQDAKDRRVIDMGGR